MISMHAQRLEASWTGLLSKQLIRLYLDASTETGDWNAMSLDLNQWWIYKIFLWKGIWSSLGLANKVNMLNKADFSMKWPKRTRIMQIDVNCWKRSSQGHPDSNDSASFLLGQIAIKNWLISLQVTVPIGWNTQVGKNHWLSCWPSRGR